MNVIVRSFVGLIVATLCTLFVGCDQIGSGGSSPKQPPVNKQTPSYQLGERAGQQGGPMWRAFGGGNTKPNQDELNSLAWKACREAKAEKPDLNDKEFVQGYWDGFVDNWKDFERRVRKANTPAF
jgi:hypothetical protein